MVSAKLSSCCYDFVSKQGKPCTILLPFFTVLTQRKFIFPKFFPILKYEHFWKQI